MSRSNPNENSTPNPATRWFEWAGDTGVIRYYDKDAKQTVEVGNDFKFMLLDQLGSVGGWHEASGSSIYSNEVKDTRQEALIVKAFKEKQPLAEGIYKVIKDRVAVVGGQFVANCYIAFKNGGDKLAIGSLRFKGAALGAWMDFCKAHRSELYTKAIRINGFTEGKKGRVVFRVPTLVTADLSPATDAAAVALDKELQKFFAAYFKRTTVEQAETAPADPEPVGAEPGAFEDDVEPHGPVTQDLTDDDIPFAWLMPFIVPALGLLSAGMLA